MLFGKPGESGSLDPGHHPAAGYNLGNMLDTIVMIAMAIAIMVMGVKVPGFIDETIRTCVQVMGVN
jgi:hypothetical protein